MEPLKPMKMKTLPDRPKLSLGLLMQVSNDMDGVDVNTMSLSVIFRAKAKMPKMPGVKIRANIGDTIYTADISLAGLSKLEADKNVISIEGNQKLPLIKPVK